ncbi:uncharacterized protein LOC141695835 [Apium graveolens]|uniref:uncharacterized protein LOC141695835 n=1 Tax=Apium graveolens TaxID=4045 RepID=UPI003D7B42BC
MVGRGSGKRLALIADEYVDNSSSEENFHLHDDDEEEDFSGSDERGWHLERNVEISSIFPIVWEEHHVPRVPWFRTEKYIPPIIDSPNDMYVDEDLDQGELSEGKCYRDKATLLLAAKRAHISTDRTYNMTKSNKEQLIVQCRAKGCNWRTRAAFIHNSSYWRINVNREEHRCMVDQLLQDHKKLSARMISGIVIDTQEIPIKTIIPLIKNEHNHIVGYKKAWRGKQIAIEEVYGSWDTTYQALPIFLAAIKKTNPGTIAEIDDVPHAEERGTSVCKRIFWYLKAMMDGWQHARLIRTTTFFPLCYGLVDEETYENWSWFLQRIRKYVCRQKAGVCIISDRAAGIISAIRDPQNGFDEPLGIQRFCLLHVISNFYHHHPGSELKKLMWKAGITMPILKHDAYMARIGEIPPSPPLTILPEYP